ncbi:MAG TPA: EamA/RhaT family transporter, partial [Ottowia sp.]|nr:EamA/RhaT family transporter [Ottowia sp.]
MNARREQLDGRAIGILLACCLFWGVQQVLVKATLPELAPV